MFHLSKYHHTFITLQMSPYQYTTFVKFCPAFPRRKLQQISQRNKKITEKSKKSNQEIQNKRN